MRTAVICMWLLVALCAIATTTQAYRRHYGIRCFRFRGRKICMRVRRYFYRCRYQESGGKLIRVCGRCRRYYSGGRWRYRCVTTSRRTIKRSYSRCYWRTYIRRYGRRFRRYRRRICIRCTRYLVRGRHLRTRCRRV